MKALQDVFSANMEDNVGAVITDVDLSGYITNTLETDHIWSAVSELLVYGKCSTSPQMVVRPPHRPFNSVSVHLSVHYSCQALFLQMLLMCPGIKESYLLIKTNSRANGPKLDRKSNVSGLHNKKYCSLAKALFQATSDKAENMWGLFYCGCDFQCMLLLWPGGSVPAQSRMLLFRFYQGKPPSYNH